MPNLNKVILMGTLTRDPEIKFTQSGKSVGNIGLAINKKYKTSSGEAVEDVVFVDVELWGRTAEIAGEYMRKGKHTLIEGALKLYQWTDKNTGEKRSRLKVVAEGLQLLGNREQKERASYQKDDSESPQQRQEFIKPMPSHDDDEI